MADAKDNKPRTFTKKGPDGATLTRVVSTVSDEVAANYDGYFEQSGSKASSTTSSSTAASAKP